MAGIDDLGFLGTALNRPECVVSHSSGCLFVSDWTDGGGVAIIRPDGTVRRHLASDANRRLRPNGIALIPGGRFLLAHLGDQDGGVWQLDPDGRVEPVVVEVEGDPVPPTNFVHRDRRGRLWITVSTRRTPRALGYRAGLFDGYVILKDDRGSRVVAEGLGFANECVVHPSGEQLFVNETFARRTLAFPILADGSLGPRRVVAAYGEGTFPDGLTFDADGGVWITSIVSNRVIRVGPDGEQQIILEDSDPAHLAWVEAAYRADEMDRPHLDTMKSRRLRNISSLAFGGPDLRTGYLGCLLGDSIACFRSPVAGQAPPHWDFDLGDLMR